MAVRNLFIGNPPERMEIHISKKKQLVLFFLGLFMASACVFTAYVVDTDYVSVKIIGIRISFLAIYFKIFMVFGACFFALLPIMRIIKAIYKVPLAILDAEEVKLPSLKGLAVKWQDITSYECYSINSHEFLGFNVHDPAVYLNNLPFLKRIFMSLNRKTGFADFSFMISKEEKQDILHMFYYHLEKK